MQENIVITDDAITGTLKKLSAGDLVDYWGEGNFIALKFTLPEGVKPEEVQVGLKNPVALDSDLNGVWKIESNTQKLKVIYDGQTKEYDLSGLTLIA